MTDTVRDILLALVRVHILHHAVAARIFGAGMSQELARHGYQISPGTLYPLLHRLEQDGLLTSESEVVAGKARKSYVATDKGRLALAALQPRLAELTGEALPKDSHHDTRATKKRKPARH